MGCTFFFRDLHSIEHVAAHVLRDFGGCARVRVWDAGCANGPEPYTLAIVLATKMGAFGLKSLQIDATDLDGSGLFGDIIAAGIYSNEELERVPKDLLEKYFGNAPVPEHRKISTTITDRVRFQKHDLLGCREIGEGFHLVVCKNVLLHFSPHERVLVLQMFHRALQKGGYLVMEQTQKLPAELTPLFEHVTPDAQIYRKIDA